MSTVKIHGIKACDTMKKAITWLEKNDIEYVFQDYKKEPASAELLKQCLEQLAWDELINKRGTTWRKLSDDDKSDMNNEKAISLALANNSLIKRPLLLVDNKFYLGFKADTYAKIFNK